VRPHGRRRGCPQRGQGRWDAVRARSSRPFCPCKGRSGKPGVIIRRAQVHDPLSVNQRNGIIWQVVACGRAHPPPCRHVGTCDHMSTSSAVGSWAGRLAARVACRPSRAAAPRGGRAPGRGAGWHKTCTRSVQPPCATAGGDAWRAGRVPQRPDAPGWRGGVHRPLECPIRLVKALWACPDNRIGVRFPYEWHTDAGPWSRSDGHERWEVNERGVRRRREASITDVSRAESDRKCFWPAPGPRLADHPGIPDVESPGFVIRFTRLFRGNQP
jgi:hypothetical protein